MRKQTGEVPEETEKQREANPKKKLEARVRYKPSNCCSTKAKGAPVRNKSPTNRAQEERCTTHTRMHKHTHTHIHTTIHVHNTCTLANAHRR